jgi:hypothetical protein
VPPVHECTLPSIPHNHNRLHRTLSARSVWFATIDPPRKKLARMPSRICKQRPAVSIAHTARADGLEWLYLRAQKSSNQNFSVQDDCDADPRRAYPNPSRSETHTTNKQNRLRTTKHTKHGQRGLTGGISPTSEANLSFMSRLFEIRDQMYTCEPSSVIGCIAPPSSSSFGQRACHSSQYGSSFQAFAVYGSKSWLREELDSGRHGALVGRSH